MSILPMRLVGVSAEQIRKYADIKDLILTKEMMLACTTRDMFKQMLYDEWGKFIASDNIDKATFNYSKTEGIALRYGALNAENIEIFTTIPLPIPRKITIGYYYYNGNDTFVRFRLISNTENLGKKYIFDIYDSGASVNIGDPSVRINHSTTYIQRLTYAGTLTGTQVINIPSDVPNCISDKDTKCTLSLESCLGYVSGYNTTPVYIDELRIEF